MRLSSELTNRVPVVEGAGALAPAVTASHAQKEKNSALPAPEESTGLSRSSLTSLKIYSNEYDRGAIVKLAQSHSVPAVAKFIIKKHHGTYELLDGNGVRPRSIRTFKTQGQATDQAIRECERIRDHLTGGDCVRSEG